MEKGFSSSEESSREGSLFRWFEGCLVEGGTGLLKEGLCVEVLVGGLCVEVLVGGFTEVLVIFPDLDVFVL